MWLHSPNKGFVTLTILIFLLLSLINGMPTANLNEQGHLVRKERHIGGIGGFGFFGGGFDGGYVGGYSSPPVYTTSFVPVVYTTPVLATVPVVSNFNTVPTYSSYGGGSYNYKYNNFGSGFFG